VKRIRVRRVALLNQLDQDEMVKGYLAGWDGAPEPGPERSYSYWHGWCSAALDHGDKRWAAANAELAADIQRFNRS